MKAFVFFALVACAFCLSSASAIPVAAAAAPAEEGVDLTDLDVVDPGYAVHETNVEDIPAPEWHSRQKRATCDLLSAVPNINHSACAAHCILLRHKGGYCNAKAVCVCRN